MSKIKEIHARVTEFCSGNEMRTSGRGMDGRTDGRTDIGDANTPRHHFVGRVIKIQYTPTTTPTHYPNWYLIKLNIFIRISNYHDYHGTTLIFELHVAKGLLLGFPESVVATLKACLLCGFCFNNVAHWITLKLHKKFAIGPIKTTYM